MKRVDRNRTFISGIVLLAGMLITPAWGADCEISSPTGTRCKLSVEQLHPTQFSVGSVAANCRATRLANKSWKKLKKYFKAENRRIPVVIGPEGRFYMTDRHHLATALFRAYSPDWKNKRKTVHVHIIDNYQDRNMSWGQFWEDMLTQHRSYNVDNKGTPDMNFALLPENVSGLLNDPYRTLSRWVRESCGYVKKGKKQCDDIRTTHPHKAPFFMELYWGDFFRKHLQLDVADLEVCKAIPYSPTCLPNEATQLKRIYKQAMQLAGSTAAKQYFEDRNLDPWEYGYNSTGEYLKLDWGLSSKACPNPSSP